MLPDVAAMESNFSVVKTEIQALWCKRRRTVSTSPLIVASQSASWLSSD